MGPRAGDLKDASRSNGAQNLERVWLPSASLGGAAATLAAVFVDGGYYSPSGVSRCGQWTATSQTCNYAAGAEDVEALIAAVERHASAVHGGVVLINMGTDFRWPNAVSYFEYVDGLIDAINKAPSGLYTAFYSSPADYAASRIALPSLPVLVGDLFPYNEGHDIWSGYFTSRPSFKDFVRESSAYMQAARQLQALVGGVTDTSATNLLFKLERALGVCQHHDGVSGTALVYVTRNYEALLEDGRADANSSIAASFAAVTGYSASP